MMPRRHTFPFIARAVTRRGVRAGSATIALCAALLQISCGGSDRDHAAGAAAPAWAVGTWGGGAFQEFVADSSWSVELIVPREGEITLRYEHQDGSCAGGLALDSATQRAMLGRELEETSCDPFGGVVEIRRTGVADTLFCRWRTREGGGAPGYAWLARR